MKSIGIYDVANSIHDTDMLEAQKDLTSRIGAVERAMLMIQEEGRFNPLDMLPSLPMEKRLSSVSQELVDLGDLALFSGTKEQFMLWANKFGEVFELRDITPIRVTMQNRHPLPWLVGMTARRTTDSAGFQAFGLGRTRAQALIQGVLQLVRVDLARQRRETGYLLDLSAEFAPEAQDEELER